MVTATATDMRGSVLSCMRVLRVCVDAVMRTGIACHRDMSCHGRAVQYVARRMPATLPRR